MANVPESPEWTAGVYQIETTDPVVGGVNGIANAQAKALANRTQWLRNWLESGNSLLARMLALDGVGSGVDADYVRGLPADFSASLGVSGYQKLPSGLIVQWGQASATAGGSGVAVTLPITFPTTILFGVASVANTGGNSGALAGGIRLDSQVQITVFNNGNQTATAIYWLVFGK